MALKRNPFQVKVRILREILVQQFCVTVVLISCLFSAVIWPVKVSEPLLLPKKFLLKISTRILRFVYP